MTLVQNLQQQLSGYNLILLILIIKKLITYYVLAIALIFSLKINAQVDTTTVHQINGKDYYIHNIEQGNTLYFLSKVYNTPIDIIKKETEDYVGAVGFTILEKNDFGGNAELGYFILKDFWGKGYATEAAQRVIDFAFQVVGQYNSSSKNGLVKARYGLK